MVRGMSISIAARVSCLAELSHRVADATLRQGPLQGRASHPRATHAPHCSVFDASVIIAIKLVGR